VDKGKIQLSDF